MLGFAFDIVLIGAHAADWFFTGETGQTLNLGSFQSLPSVWNYAKLACLALLLAALCLHRGSPAMLFLSAIFVTLALDDYRELHELFGFHLSVALDLASQVGALHQDIGELIALVGLGLVVGLFFGAAFLLRRPCETGLIYRFVALVAVIAIFGVAVDLLHSMSVKVWGASMAVDQALLVVEDGGEMLAITLAFAFGLSVAVHDLYTDRTVATDPDQPEGGIRKSARKV